MENKNLNYEVIEKFETIGNRMFNIKHCFELFLYILQNECFNENSVEIITFALILKDYFNQTKEKYNELEHELGVAI